MPYTLTCRYARAAEIGDIARLVAHSFPGTARPVDWLREQLEAPRFGGGADTLLVGEADGRPVAALQLHPLRQWVGSAELACAGVGTVTVSPAHRQRGLAAALMTAALRAALERGDTVSALYPFRVAFYRRLGYGHASAALQYQFAPHMLGGALERERVVLLDDEGTRAAALGLYNEWARTQTGQLTRTARMWAEQVPRHDRVLVGYRDGHGALRGYCLGSYRVDSGARCLEIDELVWTTPDARRGLHAWIASLADQWPQVLLRGLPSHRLDDWIREPRLPAGSAPMWQLWAPMATLMAGPMFRILDVQRAWHARSVAPDSRLDLTFEVQDAQLDGNSGRWRVIFADGRAHCERGSGAATMSLDIGTLSRLYIGALPASAAVAAGLAVCDRPGLLAALDAALALPEPWTFDRF